MGFLGLSNTGTKIIFIGTTSLLPREAGSAGSCQSHIGNYKCSEILISDEKLEFYYWQHIL